MTVSDVNIKNLLVSNRMLRIIWSKTTSSTEVLEHLNTRCCHAKCKSTFINHKSIHENLIHIILECNQTDDWQVKWHMQSINKRRMSVEKDRYVKSCWKQNLKARNLKNNKHGLVSGWTWLHPISNAKQNKRMRPYYRYRHVATVMQK